jgi:DHA2 family multidrug resistance protein
MMFTGVFAAFLGPTYGIRRVLLVAGAIFTAASIALPFATGLPTMLALEAVAGVSVGCFYTLTMTFVARNLPRKLLLFGIAAYALDIVVSSHLGFFIHGWYMDHLSWRWIFWTGAVLMPLTMVCLYFGVPPASMPERPNWRSFFYLGAGLSLVYAALDQGQRLDWWNSGIIVGMLAGGLVLVAASLIRRYVHPNPLVNLRFLGSRNVLIIGLGIFVIRFSLLGPLLIVPNFLGTIAKYRPLETGEALAWVAAPQFLVVWIAAVVCVFIQPRIVMAAGFTAVAIGCWLGARVDASWAGNSFAVPELVMAIGIGVAFVALVTNIILILVEMGGIASVTDSSTYSAFMHTIRLMGGQIGAVALGRFLTVREEFHSNLLGQYVNSGNWLVAQRLHGMAAALTPFSSGPKEAQARSVALLAGQVRAQAFTLACSDAFLAIAWVIALYLAVIVFLRPPTISLRPQEKPQ